MSNEICEHCGKRRKRYRSAFNSWICDNCKKETLDYKHPDAFIKVESNNWWLTLSNEEKIEIYLNDKQNKDNNKGNNNEIV
jgi:hypothetical protein